MSFDVGELEVQVPPAPIRAGLVRVSFGLLASALRLPEGHRIVGVRDASWDWHSPETMELKIVGPLMPEVSPGEMLSTVSVILRTVRREDDVEWVEIRLPGQA